MTPKLHFKKFSQPWTKKNAADLFESVSDKGHPELPILSATQGYGMVRRDKFGLNVFHDKANEGTYKRVLPGQFVIHLRSFQGGFAHSPIEGITSPAYTVFKIKNHQQQEPLFWKRIFSSERFVNRLQSITYGGSRDGRAINFQEFLLLDFFIPENLEEQKKIAHVFETLDKLISLQEKIINHFEKIKSTLLKRCFQ